MPQQQDLITVARLMKPHGVKGDIKAEPLSHDPQRYKRLKKVTLELPNGTQREAEVAQASSHGSIWHLRFVGFDSPESAAALNNALVQIPSTERLPPPKDQYYPSDLVGLTVLDQSGKARGKVLGLVELPSVNSFELRVDGKDIMAPWIPPCILAIDLAAKTLQVDLEFLADVYPELAG